MWANTLFDFGATVVATLIGVVVAIRWEAHNSRTKEGEEAKKAISLVRTELNENLDVATRIANQQFDFPAVLEALIGLREEFWFAVSRGGLIAKAGDPYLLRSIAAAYDKVRTLRMLGDLFFKGGELVREKGIVGFTPRFDPIRKDEAEKAVEVIKCALAGIDGLDEKGSRASH